MIKQNQDLSFHGLRNIEYLILSNIFCYTTQTNTIYLNIIFPKSDPPMFILLNSLSVFCVILLKKRSFSILYVLIIYFYQSHQKNWFDLTNTDSEACTTNTPKNFIQIWVTNLLSRRTFFLPSIKNTQMHMV